MEQRAAALLDWPAAPLTTLLALLRTRQPPPPLPPLLLLPPPHYLLYAAAAAAAASTEQPQTSHADPAECETGAPPSPAAPGSDGKPAWRSVPPDQRVRSEPNSITAASQSPGIGHRSQASSAGPVGLFSPPGPSASTASLPAAHKLQVAYCDGPVRFQRVLNRQQQGAAPPVAGPGRAGRRRRPGAPTHACKSCGALFPSYYFVQKHRRRYHSE